MSEFENDVMQSVDNVYMEEAPQPVVEKKGFSKASMILGICGLLAWCIPLFGLPVGITGLVLGILGIKKGGKKMAIAGIVLCAITLVLSLINAILGAVMALNMMSAMPM